MWEVESFLISMLQSAFAYCQGSKEVIYTTQDQGNCILPFITIFINHVAMRALINTGASVNLMSVEQTHYLQLVDAICSNQVSRIFTYGA